MLVPPGDYLTGSIALRSNTALRLEWGTGSGLKGATAIPTPQLPEPVTALARPYNLR